ncbi:hypothetical protein TRVL_03856 [Trypanosoma vivax]|nr:hypothetical protein TRVL_03856 [Trypanosoma vivax]
MRWFCEAFVKVNCAISLPSMSLTPILFFELDDSFSLHINSNKRAVGGRYRLLVQETKSVNVILAPPVLLTQCIMRDEPILPVTGAPVQSPSGVRSYTLVFLVPSGMTVLPDPSRMFREGLNIADWLNARLLRPFLFLQAHR